MTAARVPALDDGEPMRVGRAWLQWQRNGVLYRQYHHDDGSATLLARTDDGWFCLLPDPLRWCKSRALGEERAS